MQVSQLIRIFSHRQDGEGCHHPVNKQAPLWDRLPLQRRPHGRDSPQQHWHWRQVVCWQQECSLWDIQCQRQGRWGSWRKTLEYGSNGTILFSFPTFILVSTYLPTNFRSLARSKPSTTSWEPGRRRGGARIWWRVLMSTRDQELWVSRKGAGWWASLWGAQCRSSVRLRTGPSESVASIWSWPSGRWRRSSSVPRVTSWTGWVV